MDDKVERWRRRFEEKGPNAVQEDLDLDRLGKPDSEKVRYANTWLEQKKVEAKAELWRQEMGQKRQGTKIAKVGVFVALLAVIVPLLTWLVDARAQRSQVRRSIEIARIDSLFDGERARLEPDVAYTDTILVSTPDGVPIVVAWRRSNTLTDDLLGRDPAGATGRVMVPVPRSEAPDSAHIYPVAVELTARIGLRIERFVVVQNLCEAEVRGVELAGEYVLEWYRRFYPGSVAKATVWWARDSMISELMSQGVRQCRATLFSLTEFKSPTGAIHETDAWNLLESATSR